MSADQHEEAPVDLSYLHDYTDGDPDAMNELLEIFHETFVEELRHLQESLAEGHNQAWTEYAHKLKGASGYVGAEKLRAFCSQAQNMLEASADERKAVFALIKQNYEIVCKFLEARET